MSFGLMRNLDHSSHVGCSGPHPHALSVMPGAFGEYGRGHRTSAGPGDRAGSLANCVVLAFVEKGSGQVEGQGAEEGEEKEGVEDFRNLDLVFAFFLFLLWGQLHIEEHQVSILPEMTRPGYRV